MTRAIMCVFLSLMALLHWAGEFASDTLTAATAGSHPTGAPITRVMHAAAPGLFLLRGSYLITAPSRADSASATDAGLELLLPLPLAYREQVPLTYHLTVQPPGHLKSGRIVEDRPGNWVANIRLRPERPGRNTMLIWTSLVLAGPRSFADVPRHAPIPTQWPEEVRPWLASTRCVEAGDERIRAAAQEIRGQDQSVIGVIKLTLDGLGGIYARQHGNCTELDAVQALDLKGSCTSSANLAAALLRANGIPARILAGYATWYGAHQTHYIVEAWVPDYGWFPIEPTLLQGCWDPWRQIEVAIVPPEFENRSQLRPGAFGGVPYLSLTEIRGDEHYVVRGMVDSTRDCDHIAECVEAFGIHPGASWDRAYEPARKRWSTWLAVRPRVEANGHVGTPRSFASVERAHSLDELVRALQAKRGD